MSGLGRGGRGALLLKALETPMKIPGQPVQNGHSSSLSEVKPVAITTDANSNVLTNKVNGHSSPPSEIKPAENLLSLNGHSQPDIKVLVNVVHGTANGHGILAHQLSKQLSTNLPEQQTPGKTSPTCISPTLPASVSPSLPTHSKIQSTSPVPVIEMDSMSITSSKSSEKGTQGTTNPMYLNFVKLKCRNEGAFQYNVTFNPPIESKNMRFGMLKEHTEVIGKAKAFDGSTLFLPHRLPQPQINLTSKRQTDNTAVQVTITLVKVLAPSQCMQLYNVLLRRIMKILELQQVGRYYYDPKSPALIPQHKLELWPGYITAIQTYEGGIMLLADVSHRLLRTDTCLNYMYDIIQKNQQDYQNEVTKKLVGTIVLTRYNNKTYRIDDIAWDKTPESTFTYHDGEEMSYVEYYKKSYNKELSDLGQPLLIHRPKEPKGVKPKGKPLEVICLIPELCSMTGLTDDMRADFRVMKDIAQHTRITPNQRQMAMRKYIKNIYNNPIALAELENWGLHLEEDLLKTEGRLLPPEKIILGNNKSIICNREADWGKEATREAVITGIDINSWMVISTKRDQPKAFEFVQTMKQCCPQMGFKCGDPFFFALNDDRTETYLRTIRENLNQKVQCVVCIFPTSRDDRYAAVKKLCCIESPVPSQMINARTISQANKLRSVTQKVALQINVKLGGELWALNIPMKNVMICGIDVHHDTSKGSRSVGGFVASTNSTFTRWYSRCVFQNIGQELIDGLKLCFVGALKKYHDENHSLPEKIFVFRDGVGDGQLEIVSNYEIKQLQDCFPLLNDSYHPKMCVVVVQKRISQRLFAIQNGGLDNPAPGSVLDHTVTRKDWFDFFLVSQHVRQGTVTPTHYVVVYDDTGLKPDHIQRLSYKLTHLYYNWPGTIRVPAPCQYAHKLAFLVGTSLHKDPALELSDRLFFL